MSLEALVADADALVAHLAAADERRDRYKILRYFHDCLPDCKDQTSPYVEDHVPLPGNPMPTCRVLYGKSLAFFRAGAQHRERLFLAANRIGKTETAAFEVRCHLTGQYPRWWEGRRFDGPGLWWAAGDTMLTTRDIIQTALLGPHQNVPTADWTGMVDPHRILDVTRKSGGITNCVDTIFVRWGLDRHHGAPLVSSLAFLSYDMGRRVFQGTERHGIWLDEEPPDPSDVAEAKAAGASDIYTECLLRTMTTDGLIIATFTPLRGMTRFIQNYIDTCVMPGTDGQDMPASAHFYPGGATS